MEVITQDYFIVDFKTYCKTCKHKDKADMDEPCDLCLDNPTNLHSQKPIKWEKPSSR